MKMENRKFFLKGHGGGGGSSKREGGGGGTTDGDSRGGTFVAYEGIVLAGIANEGAALVFGVVESLFGFR